MRILQVVWSLRRGGAERVCIDLSRGLHARGHKVAIATLADVNEWEDTSPDGLIETIAIWPGRFPRWRTEFLLLAIRLGHAINGFDPDIVHTHCLASTIAAWLSRHPPHAATIHGTHTEPIGNGADLFRELNRALYRRSIERVPAYIVATTSESIPRIRKVLGVGADWIRTIGNGIDVEHLAQEREERVSHAELKIGMVGSLIPAKNHELAIRGLRAMREKGVRARLHICGQGSQRSFLESLVSELDLGEFVVFEGMCTDIPSFLRSIDIFWMTSHYEGHSIALLEAMAARVPCIVTDVSGLGFFARQWNCAVTVPAGNPEALAAATMQLMGNPDEAQCLANRARNVVRSHFTVEKMTDEYERLYELAR